MPLHLGVAVKTCRNIPQKTTYEWLNQEEFFNNTDAF